MTPACAVIRANVQTHRPNLFSTWIAQSVKRHRAIVWLLLCVLLGHHRMAMAEQVSEAEASVEQRFMATLDQAELAKRRDGNETIRLIRELLAKPELARYPELELRARFLICDELIGETPELARAEIERGRQLAQQSSKDAWRAAFLSCEGNLLERQGQSAEAEQKYTEAVGIAELARDDYTLAHALYQRGYLRGIGGQYSGGLADLQRAHALYEALAMTAHARTVINSIATLYNRMGDFAQARVYYERSVKLLEAVNEPSDLGIALYNLGRTLENLALYDEARLAFERALRTHESIQSTRGMAYAKRGLGSVLNAQLQPEKALVELDAAMLLAKKVRDSRLQAQVQLQQGIAFRQLKRYRDARINLEQSLQFFRQSRSQHDLRDGYAALAVLYAEVENWRAAYQTHVSLKQVSEQLLTSQRDEQFALMKVQFDTRYQEQQNLALQKEKAAIEQALTYQQRANRLQVVVIVLGTLAMLILVWAVRRQWRHGLALQEMAMTDELTGLANRRRVLAELERLRSPANGGNTAVLIADLDHFKALNDRFGHLAGDKVLKRVAAAFRTVVREHDIMGRLGGEEFLLVLPQTEKAEALQVADRIRAAVAVMSITDIEPTLQLTISLGGTACKPDDSQVGIILRRADEALYDAKESGRNRVNWRD